MWRRSCSGLVKLAAVSDCRRRMLNHISTWLSHEAMGGSVVEADVLVPFAPAVVFGFVGVEIVEDDRNVSLRVGGHDAVHEVQKLDPAAAPVMARLEQSGGHFQSRKPRRGPVPLVVVGEAAQGFAIGQPQPALGAFQRLDVWLLVPRQYDGVLGRVQIQPHHVGGFLGETGVGAHTPTAASLQADPMFAQHPPDLVVGNVLQRRGQQSAVPAGITGGRWALQLPQNPLLGAGIVTGRLAAAQGLAESGQPLCQKAAAPLAHGGRTCLVLGGNRLVAQAVGSTQNDLRPKYIPAAAGAGAGWAGSLRQQPVVREPAAGAGPCSLDRGCGPDSRQLRAPAEDRQARCHAHSEAAAGGSLSAVVDPPTAEIRNQRQLLVHRHKLVRLRAQVKNELQHLAMNQGVQKKARLWSQAGQKLLRELPLAGWAAARRANLLELMKLMDRQIAELDRALEQAAEENPQARLLRTQPGVGPVTALAFVLTLGDVSRFPRGKQLASYLGLIPREHSSGGRQRLGAISKQGNRFLRQTLVEAAHSVVRLDEGFRKQYQHRCHRKPKGVAKVAAARKLAVRLYWMLRTNIGYPEIVHIESRSLVPLVDHGQTETLNGRSRIQQTGAKDGPAGLGKR